MSTRKNETKGIRRERKTAMERRAVPVKKKVESHPVRPEHKVGPATRGFKVPHD